MKSFAFTTKTIIIGVKNNNKRIFAAYSSSYSVMGPVAKYKRAKPRLQQDHAKGLRRTDWGCGNGNLVFSEQHCLQRG